MNKILIGALSTAAAVMLSGCATTSSKTPDAAIDQFLCKHLNVQFGDDISKLNGYEDAQYMIPMKKSFQYFDKACVYYRKGKLFRVNIWTDIGKEYSQVSTEAQMKLAMSKLARALALPDSYFNTPYVHLTIPSWGAQTISNPSKEKQVEVPQLTYAVRYATAELPNYRRYVLDIIDTKLEQSQNRISTPPAKKVPSEVREQWGIPLPKPEEPRKKQHWRKVK